MAWTLTAYLRDCAAETSLRLGVYGRSVEVLRQALSDDPDLKQAALVVIDTTAPTEQRDHIARWRNSVLRHALGIDGDT